MVDPFFTTQRDNGQWAVQWSAQPPMQPVTQWTMQWSAQPSVQSSAQPSVQWATQWQQQIQWQSIPQNNQQWIQVLLAQQRQIQEKYKELKELYTTNQLTDDQKQELQVQMQKLSDLYNQNKQTLIMLSTAVSGDKEVHTNKDIAIKTEKNSRKISFSGIVIGCSAVFTLLMWWLAGIFYLLIQNPNSLTSMWISSTTAVQLLQVFSIIFFGLIFLISLGLIVLNFYRIVTVKNKKKISYVWWLILWFLLLVGTLVLGSKVFNILKNISPEDFIDSNQLVTAEIVLAWNQTKKIWSDSSLVLIAPVNIIYQLNWSLLKKQFANNYGDVSITNVTLDCGNKTQVWQNITSQKWACFYPSKWSYPIALTVTYVNNQTNEQRTTTAEVGSMVISSEIKISTNQWDAKVSNNELIVWKNPVKVTYDASNIFVDLSLSEYKITWDADADWVTDRSDYSVYTHVYSKAWVLNVNYRLPWINNYLYTFPIRIEQSDVPAAQVSYTEIDTTQYRISVSFPDDNPNIAEYAFSVLDKQNNKNIYTLATKSSSINYTFPGDGVYAVKVSFITQEWKQWSAEGENIEIWWTQYTVSYDIQTKTPTMPSFSSVSDKENILVTELPTVLRLNVTNISPYSATTVVKVLIDWSPIVWKDNVFDTTIEDTKDYVISLVVSDPNHKDMTYTKDLKLTVKRDDIVPKLLITPSTVGTSPFNVTFDASTTSVNDADDEIIYFTWDFGDGEIERNLSQSIIEHTYKYDYEKENGEYHPSVTLKTKKWRELVVSGDNILVKKPSESVTISLDSHPAQTAAIWDKVDMSISVNWTPTKIIWDFWNGNTLECKARECLEASQIYEKDWTYEISVSVSYEDRPMVDWKINLVVR